MNKKELTAGAGAAGTVFAANAAASAVPTISAVSPLCTSVCGTCGGGCIVGIGAVLWLSAAAAYKTYKGGKNRE